MSNTRRSVTRLDKFLGLNLKDDPVRLPFANKGATELTKADNVDISDTYKPSRRPGYKVVLPLPGAHSLWSNRNHTLFAHNGGIRKIRGTGENLTSTPVVTGLDKENRVSYAEAYDTVYWTNDQRTGMVVPGGDHHPWAVEEPTRQPAMSSTSGGIPAGTEFMAFMTFVDDLGRESGADQGTYFKVTSGGILFSNLQVPNTPFIVKKRLYLTPCNGDEFYLVMESNATRTTFSVTSPPTKTVHGVNQFLSQPVPGHDVAYSSGRLWIADTNWLYYSEPLQYHLFKLRENFFPFHKKITVLAPVEDGLFIVADKTYFLSARDEVPTLRYVSDNGGVEGSFTAIDGKHIGDGREGLWAAWNTGESIVLGGPSGTFQDITQEKIAIDNAYLGATMVRCDRGFTQIVSTARCGEPSNRMFMGDTADATVIRCAVPSTVNRFDSTEVRMDNMVIRMDEQQ